jgi:predicted nuclease of predicted toxin-antitoxin system
LLIKVDEDLPQAAVEMLKKYGYDAASVLDEKLGGSKDSVLWQVVQAECGFLITADKGFGNVRLYAPGKHHGVMLLRPDEDGIRPILALLQLVLASRKLDDFKSTLVVVTPRGIRVRRSSDELT